MSKVEISQDSKYPQIYNVGNWSMSLTDGDGELEYVDEAIAAWTAWRDFLRNRAN